MTGSPSIAILGPGGVGGLLAAALARSGADVTVVAREPTAETIARDGIVVQSTLLGDFTARPRVVARLTQPVDALLVATKAAALEDALARIDTPPPAQPGVVVPLLNGFDHMALLREHFAARVAAGTIRVQADRPDSGPAPAPARVVQSGRFLFVELASDDPALRPALTALATALERAGVEVRLSTDKSEARILWGKLVRLNTLACMTTAYDAPFGAIRNDPGRWAELEACVREGAAVARAEGADVDPAVVFGEFEVIHDDFGTSMQRDVAAGREPELDAIAGAVLRAGARHGLACPTIASLAARIAARAGLPTPVA
ncbi:MAG TPA: 2-dehydropantoate 2-reductase [Conexibacter sp.]|nr:2-dehydropantoate 2-reductase [Conexibacter sp.]